MLYLVLKALVSGVLIAVISEIAQRMPAFAALIASLPLVSIMAMMWLWHDTRDIQRIAEHSSATFWLVLPSLPMFLILPALLRAGHGFYIALGVSCLVTIILYGAMIWFTKILG